MKDINLKRNKNVFVNRFIKISFNGFAIIRDNISPNFHIENINSASSKTHRNR